MFGKSTPKKRQLVTNGKFELERDGHVAYLEYNLTGNVLQLIHSEVPEALRGQGVGAELAHGALEYARENHLQVDVICTTVAAYLSKHPEYNDLVMR